MWVCADVAIDLQVGISQNLRGIAAHSAMFSCFSLRTLE